MSAQTDQPEGGVPAGFVNESPFKKKTKKKDPAGTLLMALAGAGILVCLAALVVSMSA